MEIVTFSFIFEEAIKYKCYWSELYNKYLGFRSENKRNDMEFCHEIAINIKK